jgi:hypothetical protein
LLHDALAAIWRELKDSSTLTALDEITLRNLVANITQDLISKAQARNPRKLGKVYCALEQSRLSQLLGTWIAMERERPGFKVIAIEQEQEISVAGLKLTLRIDRMDEFNNGDRLLIDYKTGNVSAKSWQGERFSEPQLPLYALSNDKIAAISFAQINRRVQKWDGLGQLHDSSLTQPGIKASSDWPLQLQQWSAQLQQLAWDFMAGDARVDFKDITLQGYAQDLAPLTRLSDAEKLAQLALRSSNP